jgi:hypothetical protein
MKCCEFFESCALSDAQNFIHIKWNNWITSNSVLYIYVYLFVYLFIFNTILPSIITSPQAVLSSLLSYRIVHYVKDIHPETSHYFAFIQSISYNLANISTTNFMFHVRNGFALGEISFYDEPLLRWSIILIRTLCILRFTSFQYAWKFN